MTTAPVKSLAEIAEFVQYGYTASASEHPVGPRFLRITDIVPSQIDWDSVPYCEIDEKSKNKFSLETGDIVIARTGATVGYAKLIRDNPESVFASYLVRIRVDHQLADPGYIGRIVESNVYKQFVMSRVGGAAQPNANAKVLSAFRLPIPKRSTQSRIVEILSAYDDLIENNRRRIQLLEQAARLLYKEWFVHLRFPGHEHTPIIDGVPAGWEKVTLTEAAESVSYGLTASSSTEEIGPKFLRITDIVPEILDWEHVPFCKAEDKKIEKNQLRVGDIVVARTGATVGYAKRISDLPQDAVFASYLVRFQFAEDNISLIAGIFMESSLYKEHVWNQAGGAAQPNANAKVLGSASLLIPSMGIRAQFHLAVAPVFEMRDKLVRQIRYLAKARDLLLPRLMSGELVV